MEPDDERAHPGRRSAEPQRRRAHAMREMQAYAGGDDAAFRRLYALVSPALWGFVARRVRCRAAAEDVMQQTLLHMHRARGRYRPGADVYPWMFTIAARLIIDRHRQAQRRPVAAGPAGSLTDARPSPEQRVAAAELESHLNSAVHRLPPRQREALTLIRTDGLTHRQAAEALECSESAIKSLVHRALQALRAVHDRLDGRR